MTQETGYVTATHLGYTWRYLPNGDFEDQFTSWSSEVSGTATIVTATNAHAGSYCVSLISGDSDPATLYYDGFTNADSVQVYYQVPVISDAVFAIVVWDDNTSVQTLIEDATDEWTLSEIDISDLNKTNDLGIGFYTLPNPGGYIEALIDDVKADNQLSSATIECSYKNWDADKFNDGTFVMTTGGAKGYSCKILDTYPTYVSVATTYAPQISLITASVSSYIKLLDGFEGGMDDWTNDDALYVSDSDEQAHTGSYSVKIYQGAE